MAVNGRPERTNVRVTPEMRIAGTAVESQVGSAAPGSAPARDLMSVLMSVLMPVLMSVAGMRAIAFSCPRVGLPLTCGRPGRRHRRAGRGRGLRRDFASA